MAKICSKCKKPLNISQYSEDKKYKSCPSCSQKNGEEHVYYKYPESFGRTQKRASSKQPDGPQSHCRSCRFKTGMYSGAVLCSDINK